MDFKGYIADKINEAMEIVFGQTMEGVAGFLETPRIPRWRFRLSVLQAVQDPAHGPARDRG